MPCNTRNAAATVTENDFIATIVKAIWGPQPARTKDAGKERRHLVSRWLKESKQGQAVADGSVLIEYGNVTRVDVLENLGLNGGYAAGSPEAQPSFEDLQIEFRKSQKVLEMLRSVPLPPAPQNTPKASSPTPSESDDESGGTLPHSRQDGTSELFYVEAILAERTGADGRPEYLVKWDNYHTDEASWVQVENFVHPKKTLAEWEEDKMQLEELDGASDSKDDDDGKSNRRQDSIEGVSTEGVAECTCKPKYVPPRPANGYVLYKADMQPRMMQEKTEAAARGEFMDAGPTKVAMRWKNEPDEVKARYNLLAKEEKEEHLKRHPGYVYVSRARARTQYLKALKTWRCSCGAN